MVLRQTPPSLACSRKFDSSSINIMKSTTAALLVCFFAFCARSEDAVTVKGAKIMEVGIYKAKVVDQSNVQAGWKSDGVNNVSWVQNTTNIPARVGMQFGFRYTILGTPTNAPIMVKVEHEQPQIMDPKTGATIATNVVEIQSRIGQSYLLYTLEKEDLIPGRWKFQVLYDDKKICEQGFTIGVPLYQYQSAPRSKTNSLPAATK